jgi:hypothetical protein
MSSKARQLADLGNQVDDGAVTGTNMVINGGMTISQRGTSTTTQGFATVDRFKATSDGTMVAAVVTQSQDSTGPQGFSNSYKVSVGTSETVSAVDYYYVSQGIEAQNLQQLSFGTSYAKSITLSFWVKSSVTGTYTVSIFRHDAQRIFPKTYTVITANTWEKKVIVVDGDVTGTIANDNGRGIDLYWGLSAGSNYTTGTDGAWAGYVGANFLPNHTADIIGTTNATWQITGVCLNVGDSAIDFPHESYGDTLAKCQRYYCTAKRGNYRPLGSFRNGYGEASDFPVPMRATPTASSNSGSVSIRTHTAYNASAVVTASVYAVPINETSWSIAQNAFTTNGQLVWCYTQGWEPILMFDAEV